MRNRDRSIRALLLLLGWLLAPALHAQAAPDPSGRWEGAVRLPGRELAFDVDLTLSGGELAGDISIPAQGARDLPLGEARARGREVSFAIAGVPGEPTFRGTLDAGGQTVEGTFSQGGQSFPFRMERAAGAGREEEATAAALEGFDAWVERTMGEWLVPGLGIAVVRGGEVVYEKGFGKRDVQTGEPVTPRTLFAIGSATKAFVTLAMGQLVDEGKLKWDAPAIDYLPSLRLRDEYATMHLTPLDMVSHRSGLPRHDLIWYNSSTYVGDAVVSRLSSLEPNRQLREQWQYNNLMYALAGHLVSRLDGRSWDQAVRARILEPLGMSATVFSAAEARRAPDVAVPYAERADTLWRMSYRDVDNAVAPAGAIYSSPSDMARWVRLHLEGGEAGGRQLVQPATLRMMHSPQMVIPGVPEEPELSPRSYGLGWFIDDYRGHYRVEHGGNIDGFTALVSLFPHDDLGIVVLANKNGTPVPQFVVRQLADRFFGLEPRGWSAEALERRKASRALERESARRTEAARKRGTRPAHPLADYAGEYQHPGYGTLAVAQRGRQLVMRYNGIETPLEHWHYEVFSGLRNPADPTFENFRIQFRTDLGGEVDAVAAQMEASVEPIVFRRAADARLRDPAYLARLAGSYRLGPQTLTVTLAGDRLAVSIPGQPTRYLVPGRGGEFDLEGLSGYSVEFTTDPSGRVTEAVFRQPNGIFPARRVDGEGGGA